MEVAPYHQENATPNGKRLIDGDILRSHSWVNGVWDAKGEPLGTYVFPFMDDSEAGGSHGIKRKRESDTNADCGTENEGIVGRR